MRASSTNGERCAPFELDRRASLGVVAFGLSALAAPRPASAISDTTMGGKARPKLGVVLASEVREKRGSIVADVVLSKGKLATVAFNAPNGWELQNGDSYDVEIKSKEGDGAFLQVSEPGAQLSQPSSKFAKLIFSGEGRYGTFGEPTDVACLSDETVGDKRFLEFVFTPVSARDATVQRRVVVAATHPEGGGGEIVMLVSGCSAGRWKKGGDATARGVATSLSVATAPTELKRELEADFRYGQSGPGPDFSLLKKGIDYSKTY